MEPVDLVVRVVVILLALTVHECAHGYFAFRMGDPTAHAQGRLSLNPLRHLDPLGTICLFFAPIGWAKPVPINPLNFRDRRKGILISTAAGPVSNLCQAFLFALLLRAVTRFPGGLEAVFGSWAVPLGQSLFLLGQMGVLINIALAVFNVLPLFPLDGFHITLQLLPADKRQAFAGLASYGPFAILALIFLSAAAGVNVLGRLIGPPVEFMLRYVAGLD
jgi:Zn-dependent protease